MTTVDGEGRAWPAIRRFIAGYASGVCLVLAGHPLDTLKVRLQTEGRNGRFRGAFHCFTDTIKHEGVRGLYKGMAAPLLATGCINCVLFGVQFNLVNWLTKYKYGPDAVVATHATLLDHSSASLVSGAFISLLVTPMEGVKARLQVQYEDAKIVRKSGRQLYKGPLDCAIRVTKELGVTRGLYRGFVPVTYCRMSNWAYFGSYSIISQTLGKIIHGDDNKNEDGTLKPLPLTASLLGGGLAGFCYWLSCYPVDVIKNRIQSAPDTSPPLYKNFRHAARTIYQKEGVRGFFAGLGPCAVRAFPANAAAFFGFELAMRILPP
eukprot:m.44687 g.44687  ORF g.44687 m.44687 type:complete len:320 (-) comp17300_c0_seq2:28-987(-)